MPRQQRLIKGGGCRVGGEVSFVPSTSRLPHRQSSRTTAAAQRTPKRSIAPATSSSTLVTLSPLRPATGTGTHTLSGLRTGVQRFINHPSAAAQPQRCTHNGTASSAPHSHALQLVQLGTQRGQRVARSSLQRLVFGFYARWILLHRARQACTASHRTQGVGQSGVAAHASESQRREPAR